MGSISFRPRLVTTLAAAAMVATTGWLGNWQSSRAEEKRARQALFEARWAETPLVLTGSASSAEPLLYRRVLARGEWIGERQIYVDNQVVGGRAGFHVVTPLRLSPGGDAVLVNRGWIARDAGYPKAPHVEAPTGHVEVSGTATRPPERFRELSAQTVAGNVWQNLSIERYAAASGLSLLPVVVLADVPAPGLVAVREKPDTGVARHEEYALTWYALALTALALWIVLNVRRTP